MFAPVQSEIKGTLKESPFAELLAESSQARLSGSFRFAHEDEKAIIYLRNGEIVFAVSNLRQHRFFEMLLQSEQISREILAEIPDFTNDIRLTQVLIAKEILPKNALNELLSKQILEIVKTVLQWKSGAWNFSHLARAKENIQLQIDSTLLLLDYSRTLDSELILNRFKSFEERFAVKEGFPVNLNLLPQEAYIFSLLNSTPMKVQEIKQFSGLPDIETLKTLYVLWLGNFITRKNWNSVFSDSQLRQILSAKLTLKPETPISQPKVQPVLSTNDQEEIELELEIPEEIDEKKLLEAYLNRVETAESYYEILDVSIKAKVPEIKMAYFKFAKLYHPDIFHQETNTKIQQRVQNAFTEIARAYETLKDDSTREVYDFKLRKYLETVQDTVNTDENLKPAADFDKARQEFDQGFDHLMKQNYDEAAPFLARAVQMSSDNARYHAYYGKALSHAANQRHKAEAEIRTAIKLDSNNPAYRIMIAEFYIQFNLFKRAEGELQRLLTQFPDTKEAQVLLDSLANK